MSTIRAFKEISIFHSALHNNGNWFAKYEFPLDLKFGSFSFSLKFLIRTNFRREKLSSAVARSSFSSNGDKSNLNHTSVYLVSDRT